MTKIISIHSYRGGTGKSNTTANLATCLALRGYRVGVVDTDIQSPGVNVLFELAEEQISQTLNDFLWGHCSIEAVAYDVSHILTRETQKQGAGKVYVIPSSMKTEDITRVLSEGYDVELLQTGLYDLGEILQLDYLLIDTHPGLNEETLLAIGISDFFIVILRPDQQDYLGTAVVVEVAKNLEVPQMLLVINKVLPDVDRNSLKQQVEETYQQPVAGILLISNDMLRLGSQGLFCLKYPDHLLTAEYNQIVSLIVNHGGQ